MNCGQPKAWRQTARPVSPPPSHPGVLRRRRWEAGEPSGIPSPRYAACHPPQTAGQAVHEARLDAAAGGWKDHKVRLDSNSSAEGGGSRLHVRAEAYAAGASAQRPPGTQVRGWGKGRGRKREGFEG